MQNILQKQDKSDTVQNINEINSLKVLDIEKFYKVGKNRTLKFGLEYERLSLDKNTYKNVEYERISKILTDFSKISGWELVFDNETIIACSDKEGNSISLEPGCQLEISIKPCEKILDIQMNLTKITNLIDKIADIYDVVFLGYGVSPVSAVDEINLLNKKRYEIMNNYLPNCEYGELCPKMMRQSAGIQLNIDYFDETDAYNKLYFLNLISPFVSALFSNSPIESNKLSSFKSYRNNIWRYSGKSRCNLFYKNIFSGFNKKKKVFKNYIKAILDVPMIFIERNKKQIEINGKINFEEYLKNGYLNHFAKIDDYVLHQSLCFPDVRLKKYIEIRNHDSQNPDMAVALCAFYKGLMLDNIEKLTKEFAFLKIEKVDEYFENAAKFGLDFNVEKNLDGWEIVSKLFKISSGKLCSTERMYLKAIFELIKKRKTKADILLDYGFKNGRDVVEYYLS